MNYELYNFINAFYNTISDYFKGIFARILF